MKVAADNVRSWIVGEGTARAVRRNSLSLEAGTGKVAYIKSGPGGRDLREGDPVCGPRNGKEKSELLASIENSNEQNSVLVAEAAVKEA